jgi:hypothetical protein
MRQIFLTLFSLTTILSLGQTGNYRPFKMVIVSPDTATIDSGLKMFQDSIEADYIKGYYKSIRQMEEFLAWKNDSPNKKETDESKKKIEESLKVKKQSEQYVKRFRYFETISVYSNSVLQMYFNEYPPYSTFQTVRTSELKSNDLKEIADNFKADYVVTYSDIQTDNDNGRLIMKVTTTLYSRKKSKVLWEKNGTGDMNSYGDMWTCMNPLSCLLITCVKSSTDDIFETLSRVQKK